MYYIKYYDNYLYIPGDKEYAVLDSVLERESNKASKLEFTILDTHPLFGRFEKLRLGVAVVDDKGKVLFKGRILDSEQNFYNEYAVTVEGKLAVLNDSPCRPLEFAGTPEDLFTWFIDNHNAQVSDEQKLLKGNVTVADPNDYIARSWDKTDTTWNLINSRLIDTLGGYLIIRHEADGDYLDWLTKEDFSYSSQKVEFGENLLELNLFVDAANTYTACVPYGAEVINYVYDEIDAEADTWREDTYYYMPAADYVLIESESLFNSFIEEGTPMYKITSQDNTGERLTIATVNANKDYLINEDMAAEYGIIYAPTELVTWDDVTRPENLLSKAKNWLESEGIMLNSSVELSALDLSKLGIDIGSMEMYQKIWVESVPHNLKVVYLVERMSLKLDAPEDLRISLGNSELTFTDRTLGEKKNNTDILQRIEVVEKSYISKDNMANIVPKDGEDAVLIYIDSSRGNAFKNNEIYTVLTVMLFKGAKQITDISALRAEFGATAYLEWWWQHMDDDTYGIILSTDSRIGNDGFTFKVTADDVDTKVNFRCKLITD